MTSMQTDEIVQGWKFRSKRIAVVKRRNNMRVRKFGNLNKLYGLGSINNQVLKLILPRSNFT